MSGFSRASQKPDTIYVENSTGAAFYTPDGEGRIWYDSKAAAKAEHYAPVVHITHVDPNEP